MGARRTREEWSDLVNEFEASGDSLERFCAKRRVRIATLKWWRWRLRTAERVSAQVGERGVRLLAVDVVDRAPLPPSAVAVFVSGAELRVEIGTDVEYVGALVSALRSRC